MTSRLHAWLRQAHSDLSHLLTLEQLPLHHRDPFDRLLVAQSISESLLLVSADPVFDAYGCPLQDACR